MRSLIELTSPKSPPKAKIATEWVTTPLGAVTTKIGSGATPRGGEAAYKVSGISLIRSLNVHDSVFRHKDLAFIDNVQAELLSNVNVEPNDVLLNITGASIARCCTVPISVLPARVNQHVSILRPANELLNSRFLQYLLISPKTKARLLTAGDAGSTRQALTKGFLQEFQIQLPISIREQERIVAILDDAFDGIATAKRNAKRNLDNASALFAAARSGHLMKATLKLDGQSLGDVAEVQSGGTPLISNKSYWNGDIAWYSSGELNNTYTETPKRCISQQGLDRSNTKIFPQGSLLIGMYDTAALKMSLLDRDASFNQAIAGVKPNDSLEPLFVLHTINSQRDNILSGRRGTRQKNLSLGKIKEITIRVPSIAVQRRVVESIEQDVAVSENLAAIYHRKIELLEDVKHSLLDQAFSGKL